MTPLFVGPDVTGRERLDEAQAAWERFARAVHGGPPAGKRVFVEVFNESGLDATAVTIPVLGVNNQLNGTFWIVLGRKFFSGGLTPDRQTLTLLHESSHVKIHEGATRERTEQGLLLNNRTWPQVRFDPFLSARFDIACKYRNFAEEILSEQLLKRDFYEWFPSRWSYYLDMRRSPQPFDRIQEELKDFAFAFESLRNRLGESLAEDDGQRNEFTQMSVLKT